MFENNISHEAFFEPFFGGVKLSLHSDISRLCMGMGKLLVDVVVGKLI